MILQVDKKRRRKIGNQMGFLVVFPVVVVESLSLLIGTSTSRYALRGHDILINNNNNNRAPLHLATSFSLFFGPSNHQDLPPPDQQQLMESNIMLFSTTSLESLDSSSSSSSSVAPTWLPYPFTHAQLECLRVVELRDACAERGLKKSGTKAVLQNRLMEWVTEQHQQKQLDENNNRKQEQPTIIVDIKTPTKPLLKLFIRDVPEKLLNHNK